MISSAGTLTAVGLVFVFLGGSGLLHMVSFELGGVASVMGTALTISGVVVASTVPTAGGIFDLNQKVSLVGDAVLRPSLPSIPPSSSVPTSLI